MKKKISIIIFTLCIVLTGCGKQEELAQEPSKITATEEVVDVADDTLAEEETSNLDMTGNVPEWIAPYTQLEQYPETIYLDEKNGSFSIVDNQLAFPETNLIIVSKEIAGDERTGITDKKEVIAEVLNLLKKENGLTEDEMVNPNGKYIHMDFDLVFLSVQGEYALMEFSLFEDNRICVDITSENESSPISFWIKSEIIAEKIKSICDFEKYDLSSCEAMEEVVICGEQGTEYILNEEELDKFRDILSGLKEETSLCSGPYNIIIKGISANEEISMKWCNDGCGILAVSGYCYQLDESDSQWLQEVINGIE